MSPQSSPYLPPEANGAVAELERLCEVMHDAYEDAAHRFGWETQERSRKPWSEVPEANKRTMRHAVLALLFDLNAHGRLRPDLTRPKGGPDPSLSTPSAPSPSGDS